METYIALLRGINVGGAKKVAMADLRALLEDCGFEECRTLLNSGNAVFAGPKQATHKVERTIETAIAKTLKMDVRVLVRTTKELAATIKANPLKQATKDGSKFFVLFLDAKPKASVLNNVELSAQEKKEVAIVDRSLYMWCADGISHSRLGKMKWENVLGVTRTARNWNTVNKLLALASS